MARAEAGQGVIITYPTGTKFNILRPTPDMVHIEDIACSLGKLCRFNGHLPHPYSVAEHSVHVADELYYTETSMDAELAFAGLLHDAAEAYIGDMVYPLKSVPTIGDPFKALERELERVIGERFDVQLYPMHALVKEADREVYDWEVESIRTGRTQGWLSEIAESIFLHRFKSLDAERKR
jgi:hypothetical protein